MGIVGVFSVLAAMAVQILKGYHHFELGLYARGVIGIAGPTVLAVAGARVRPYTRSPTRSTSDNLIMVLYFVGTLVLDSGRLPAGDLPLWVRADIRVLGHESFRAVQRAAHGSCLLLHGRGIRASC